MAKDTASKRSQLPFLVRKAQGDARNRPAGTPLPRWEHLHQAAITETDPERMLKKIARAEPELFRRVLRLREHPEKHKDEIKALAEAASLLCELKLILFRKIR
jgi:hypothetical protein